MNLFLHFLNREAQRALGISLRKDYVEAIIRILSVATDKTLFTNFSNLLESEYLTDESHFLNHLIRAGEIQIAGERRSHSEFLESRRKRYQFDYQRYPMYFNDNDTSGLSTSIYLSGTTKFLHEEIISINERITLPLADKRNSSDLTSINKLLPKFVAELENRDGRAVTASLFESSYTSKKDFSATARMLSSLYIQHYLDTLALDIPTGIMGMPYFDYLSNEPIIHNSNLLGLLLTKIGISQYFLANRNEFDQTFPYLRNSPGHYELAASISEILQTFNIQYINSPVPEASNHIQRRIRQLNPHLIDTSSKLDGVFFQNANENAFLVRQELLRDQIYCDSREEYFNIIREKCKQILLVTATAIETKAMLKIAKEKYNLSNINYIKGSNFVAMELGFLNNCRLLAVQCEAGSGGSSGSQAVISDCISMFSPDCVILAGIAFGSNKAKQNIGDILISTAIREYEKSKVTETHSIPRGDRTSASPLPLGIFRTAETKWTESALHFGVILTGEKLVNSKELLLNLLDIEAEAIGGEMEGAGLRAAACREKVDWIVVKSIVDWGYEKSSDFQVSAAENVFAFILFTLDEVGF